MNQRATPQPRPQRRLTQADTGRLFAIIHRLRDQGVSVIYISHFLEEIRRIVTVFRELRSGMTGDGKTKLKSPSGTLSTAEAISVVNSGLALAAHFGDGRLRANDVAAGLVGAVVKDPIQDRIVWQEYLETVAKERKDWKDLYRACMDLGG